MKRTQESWLHKWFRVRTITFGLAVFNFVLVWTLDVRMSGIGALVDPWFHPWSYFNEPTLLLLAASLMLISRMWSYLGAIGISGYIVLRFGYWYASVEGTWLWSFQSKYDPHFIGTYESQILLGIIVLCVGLYELSGFVLRRRGEIVGG